MKLSLARCLGSLVLLSLLTACGGGGGSGGGNDPTGCNGSAACMPPIAMVLPSVTTAIAGQTVILEGSPSTGAGQLTYQWTQIAGPEVPLSNANTVAMAFTAPTLNTEQQLAFRLKVENAYGSSTADTTVTIYPFSVTATASASDISFGGLARLTALAGEDVGLTYLWEITNTGGASLELTYATYPTAELRLSAPATSDATVTCRVTVTNMYGVAQQATVDLNINTRIMPLMTSINPLGIVAGERVKISGSGFNKLTALAISNLALGGDQYQLMEDQYQVVNDHEMYLTVPQSLSATPGYHSVDVMGTGGSSSQTITIASPLRARQTSSQTAPTIAAGDAHSCAIQTDGSVACWGANTYGQLGDGTTYTRHRAVTVNGLSNATLIAAGGNHTCALHSNNTVACWGRNENGQLGNGSSGAGIYRNTPVMVNGLSNVSSIATGYNHTCALRADHTVACWGGNYLGQLGDGSTVQSDAPVTVSGLGDATAIAAGADHTCALRAGGTVVCWGRNDFGQLGNGLTTDSSTPVAVSGLSDVTAIAPDATNTCALRADNTVLCWGNNSAGQLGNGNKTNSTTPVAVSGMVDAMAIAAGSGQACALRADHTVMCWGHIRTGQQGYGASYERNTPVTVSGLSDVTAIVVGDGHACALRADLSVACWGDGYKGELGNGADTYGIAPVVVSGLSDATAVAGGYQHTCALRANHTVACWGDNYDGQLGSGGVLVFETNSNVIIPVTGLTDAIAIATGSSHSCALRANRTVVCWGDNSLGQLGNNSSTDSNAPVAVMDLNDAVAIVAGSRHTCALRANQMVVCWGGNSLGQLGNNNMTYSNVPVEVIALNKVTAISTRDDHTCALRMDQTVACWGRNDHGQLGNGVSAYEEYNSTPVTISGLDNVTSIGTGSQHTCALRTDHTAMCWGNNYSGQLGDGSFTSSNTPVEVSGLIDAKAIATGAAHTCAVRADHTVVCWGENKAGQLGDNSRFDKIRPTAVYGLLLSPTANNLLAAGASHTCSLYGDGYVACWGSNIGNQLGQGFSVPATVWAVEQ